MLVEPGVDLGRAEAQEVTPLHERNAPLGDEPADVAPVDAEASRNTPSDS